MKKVFNIFMLLLVFLFLPSCDTMETLENNGSYICVYKFRDSSYQNYVITVDEAVMPPDHLTSYKKYNLLENGILKLPKREMDEPYDFTYREGGKLYLYDKPAFELEELITESKIYWLHDGYFMFFPYETLSWYNPQLRAVLWEDLCSVNMDMVPVLCKEEELFVETHLVYMGALKKLTGKKPSQITFRDIATALNNIIDNDEKDKYFDHFVN